MSATRSRLPARSSFRGPLSKARRLSITAPVARRPCCTVLAILPMSCAFSGTPKIHDLLCDARGPQLHDVAVPARLWAPKARLCSADLLREAIHVAPHSGGPLYFHRFRPLEPVRDPVRGGNRACSAGARSAHPDSQRSGQRA